MHPARSYLFSLEQIGIKLGLDQIRGLLDALDHPEQTYRSIIVAGTNGKGSTSAMIERALRAAGYRTGRYTSPHLVHLEERFAIDGEPVTSEVLNLCAARVQGAAEALPAPPSFFEATTALGLDLFRTAAVDVAVLEVGLGGRLDATNAVPAQASAITAVDFDHQEYLGHTLEAIATEKAGVIKPLTIAVLGENPPVVEAVVERVAAEMGTKLIRAWTDIASTVELHEGRARLSLKTPVRQYAPITLGLRGRHQVQNAVTAVRLLEAIDETGLFGVPETAIRTGLEDVVWPARLEMRRFEGRAVLLDGAHNPQGARALAAYIAETYGRRLPLVVGMMRDKDLDSLAMELSHAASHVICTAAASSRAAAPEHLAEVFARVAPSVHVSVATDPLSALHEAVRDGDPAVVAGSLYLAGEIRTHLS